MSQVRYMISDAAKKLEVESHVLRYWEEELELKIGRTELGHRFYTEENIRIFQNIKELKERGIQLKAIKLLIPELKKKADTESPEVYHIINLQEKIEEKRNSSQEEKEEAPLLSSVHTNLDKVEQFEEIIRNVFKQVLQENNIELEGRITDSMAKEVDELLQSKEEKEEERYRKLDETIRSYQKNRHLVAATKEPNAEPKKKKWFFF